MNVPASLSFDGLDLLSSAVVLIDDRRIVRYANPAAENLFATSLHQLIARPLKKLMGDPPGLTIALDSALKNDWSYTSHNIPLSLLPDTRLHVDCTVTPITVGGARLLLEVRPIDQQLKAAREEQLAQQQQANRELVRNLAHEIKNPLGGIRGSAQLLERELASDHLKEYTQVIIEEVDRLQDLMQRLLSSHRVMQPTLVNIHEILERVRRLIQAEYPAVRVRRDYDTSLPDLTGDREQLIQAVLNIARNAAQAMQFAASGSAEGGIVPLSLVKAPELAGLGDFAIIPQKWHAAEPLRQRMVLLKGAGPVSRDFYRYLQTPAVREILARYGFVAPKGVGD